MIKLAILICAIRTKLATCSWQKIPVFPDNKCQFYLHYHRFKMLVLSLLSWIKITSFIFIVVVEKKPVLLFLSPLKKYQFYPHSHRLKLPILTSLSQIKIASFIFIVTYQNCQFYPYCCGWKKPVLLYLFPIKMQSLSQIKIAFYPYCCGWKKASLSIVFPDKKCQFYLHYQRSKLPVLSLLSEIIITSFFLIVVVEKS